MTRLRMLYSPAPDPAAALLVQAIHAPGLRGEWLTRPGSQGHHCMLFLHGGEAALSVRRAVAGRIALAAGGLPTLLLDYRQAPAHPLGAAVNDALAAWRGLIARGFDAARIVVAGDAAGAGPARGMLAVLREARLPAPGLVCLLAAHTDAEIERAAGRIKAWK